MRVDQTATATPTVTALPATRTIKEETRTPVAIARTEAAPSARVDGLRVSISDAARQAANAAGAAAAGDSDSDGEAAGVSNGSGPAQPLSLIDGVPWPVGVGPPPPWQPAQGAAGAASLVAPKVAEQNLSQTRSPAEAEVAREEPRADVSAQVAAQAQLAVAAVPPRANRETAQVQRSQETKPEAVQTRNTASLEARNEATRLAERRKASAVYANEAGPQAQQNLALDVKA